MWQYVCLNNKCLTNTFVNKQICHKMWYIFGPGGSLIHLLFSDKAQKMVRGVPLTNIYNMSTNNLTPNKYFTNTVGELNNRKKITGGLTFPPLQKSVIKIQTREGLQKMHKSARITNHIKYVTICSWKHIKFNKYMCKKKSSVGGRGWRFPLYRRL